MKIHEGDLIVEEEHFAVVVSRFNQSVTDRLLAGALEELKKHGAGEEQVEVFRVPGAFELPQVAARAADSGRFDALICLGALVRGETAHFEYIAGPAASSIMRIGCTKGVPVTFGLLTVDDEAQAQSRAGGKFGNKGAEAARAAIETVRMLAAANC